MGSGLDKMYDDYDDYEYICKNLGEKATRGYTDFRSHQQAILSKYGFKDKYEYFEILRKQEKRDKRIGKILGES